MIWDRLIQAIRRRKIQESNTGSRLDHLEDDDEDEVVSDQDGSKKELHKEDR